MKPSFKRLTSHGSINIPVAMRREIGIEKGDPMEVERRGSEIVISQYVPRCTFCGEREDAMKFHDRFICPGCAKKIVALYNKEESHG